ncbi:TonB-dependent receptor plug domain-containing protein [Pseudoduganella albidiflava]|uniref:TonB-dependent receptor n=1 Tax=Pseudoduganella albidiflava TaxID=321983 RepID=A0AA88C1Z9_9BURK|nr:TonB-dependent receptor [Pseudoduganella albidiflava]GGY35468.1 TonB-dependent receptor [Pseudoduganella albidiflava]
MHKHSLTLAVLATLPALFNPACAHAQAYADRQDYRLPAAPLEQTLLAIAADTGVALAYDPRLLGSARSAPVVGRYNATEAIARALDGSGFELASGGGGALTIRRRAVQKPEAPAAPQFLKVSAPAAPAIVAAAAAQPAAMATVTVSGARQGRGGATGEDPQRTPTSSYRIGGDELDEQNVTTLEELQQLVPGLNIQSTDPSDMQITIRGVGDGGGQASGDANIGMPSSVAVYVDGVYLARPGMLSSLGDIAQAEVLSGAQGTMFGANATGGIVNITTKSPTFVPEAEITVSAGQHGYQRVRGVASGPLSENWAGRLNVVRSAGDGAVTNLRTGNRLNGGSSNGLRGQLLYRGGERFTLRLSTDYSNGNSEPTSVLVATHAVNGRDGYLAHSAAAGHNVVFGPNVDLDDENRIHVVQGGVAALAEWQFGGGWQLRSVTSLRYFHSQPTMADGLSVRVYANTGTEVRDKTWSQELRLDSPGGRSLAYALGLTYLGQHAETLAHTRYADTSVPALWLDSAAFRNLNIIRLGLLRDRMLSPFAQGTLRVGDSVDITAGVRANVQKKGGSFVRYNRVPFNSGYLEENHTLPSGTLTATWRTAPGWSAYAAASYGEKSGGLNISAGAARQAGLDSLFIKPEKTRSGEIGVKASLAGDRLALKGNLFLTEVSDFQTQGYNPDDGQVYLLNAGTFISRGAEASARWAPDRHWRVDAAAVWNDTYYTHYDNARCPPEVTLAPNPPPSCNLTGSRVFNAPKLTANASVRYGWTSDSGLRSFVSARYAYRSWMFGTVDTSQFTRVPGYGLASFAAGTEGKLGEGEWSASVWLNNAFDKTYYKRLVNGEYGSVAGWLGERRTLGVSLGYRY